MKVLVVVARGLQAGALSCYGNAWIESPNLDFLASEGVVFDQHFADAVDADAVHRTWRTGRYHVPTSSVTDTADLIAALRARDIFTCLVRDTSPEKGDAAHFQENELRPLFPATQAFEEGW